jgi:TfoX/Sxy family transcriptional regulator of competence genes
MKWQKTPDELASFLQMSLKDIKCQARKMFGYPCYFINGNMFAGVFGKEIFIRLRPKDIEEMLKKHPGLERFEPRPGRVMKEYVSLPEATYKRKTVFKKLLKISVNYMLSRPPKKKKRPKR